MSRLTELLSAVKDLNPKLGDELSREIGLLQQRTSYGLMFERHRPEAVELPGHPVRAGSKVRLLPPRGSLEETDARLWTVQRVRGDELEVAAVIDGKVETQTVARDDVVLVAEFQDPIYPGLRVDETIECGGDKPFHTIINGENFHVLEQMTFTHEHAIDVIYLDPPYNSGAKDWKYNNDYVSDKDDYRHSKWLAFMERRLKIAKRLLKPENSVLIVTIDEKEYLRLGLLLEQTFPEAANIQMVSSVINPKGTSRTAYLSRVDEYIYMVFFGGAEVPNISLGGGAKEIRWRYLRRTDVESRRGTSKGGPAQFYPIYVNTETHRIEAIGEPLPHDVPRDAAPRREGCVSVFPIRDEDGMEMNWGLTAPSLQAALEAGYVRVSRQAKSDLQPYVFSYVTAPNIAKINKGELELAGKRPDGSWIVVAPGGKSSRPTSAWRETSHDAGAYGTSMLRALIPDRKFPFPKSLYAVEDVLRMFVVDKPEAVILDFFAGSGTTAHALMRLNRQDGGRRQCILVTNNEVSAEEQDALRKQGLRPGDPNWEQWGICEYITKARIRAAITGKTPGGKPVEGEYKHTDEFPMADGFEENAAFMTLTYESPWLVNNDKAFARIAPMLWLRAGAQGELIRDIDTGWAVTPAYGILRDLDQSAAFVDAVREQPGLRVVFVVTDDDGRFQQVVAELPGVEHVRLYAEYLRNFELTGDWQ